MKILIISPKNKTVYNFRGDLVKEMISAGNTVYVTGPNKDFYEELMSLGIEKFIEVPLVKDNTNILGDLRYLKELCSVIKSLKPDMIFSYTIKPIVYGCIAAKSCGVKKIYAMVTGLGRVYTSESFKSRILKLITGTLYSKAFKGCNRVIFQNCDDRDEMVLAHYVSKKKTVIVNGSGVNMARFSAHELSKENISQVTFLMVSRIIREKGVLEYCEAARIVKKQYPNTRFVLLGGYDNSIGALKPENIEPYIVDGSIELSGEVKDPVEFYRNCTVYVLPSYYREGIPRTILEAMSCGRPVITTDWIGCKEPVKNGENGYLVPVKDTKALTEAMKKMLQDKELLVNMGHTSKQICKRNYDVTKVNKIMLDIMEICTTGQVES